MLNFFRKKKQSEFLTPVTGKVIDITNVPDKVFSQKIMGDGIAFSLENAMVCAPCNGMVTMIFPTNHAFGMKTESGMEVLIHIGLETVNLEGAGFKRLIQPNQKVKAGEPIIEVDLKLLEEEKVDMTTMLVITDAAGLQCEQIVHEGDQVQQGETAVMISHP